MKVNNDVISKLVLISQIGITMLTAIAIGFVLGYYIDKFLGTHLLLIFIVLGILGGYRSVYKLIKNEIKGSAKQNYEDKEWVKKAFGDSKQNKN